MTPLPPSGIACIASFAAFVLVVLLVIFARRDRTTNASETPMERGYLLRRKCDGYLMTVGERAMQKAVKTGEYKLLGDGESIPTGREYRDERLN